MKKPAPRQDGPITKALMEAVTLRRELLDSGTPKLEADRIVGEGLRALLANPRPEAWRFYCPHCQDTGWITVEPSAEELVRLTRLYGENPQYQGYVVACEPCKWRTMEREKRRRQRGEEHDENDFVAAGKTTRRGVTRQGS